LQNTHDVVVFLNTTINLPHATYDFAILQVRILWEIKVGDVDREQSFDARTFLGSKNMHSIYFLSNTQNVLLQVKDYSFFCPHCLDGALGHCLLENYVSTWKLITLEQCLSTNALCDIEMGDTNWGMGGGSDVLAFEL
jgi:hypothetical protein